MKEGQVFPMPETSTVKFGIVPFSMPKDWSIAWKLNGRLL